MLCLYFRPSELKESPASSLLTFHSYTFSIFRQSTGFCRQELFFKQSFYTKSSFPITARTSQVPGVARLSGNSGCEEIGPSSSWLSNFRGAVPRTRPRQGHGQCQARLTLFSLALRTASHRLLFPLYPSNRDAAPNWTICLVNF